MRHCVLGCTRTIDEVASTDVQDERRARDITGRQGDLACGFMKRPTVASTDRARFGRAACSSSRDAGYAEGCMLLAEPVAWQALPNERAVRQLEK